MCLPQLEEDFVKANPEWVKELEIMVATKVKGLHLGVMQSASLPVLLIGSPFNFADCFTGARSIGIAQVKAEIQALSSFGFQYLSQVYLPLKLQEGDWI